MSLPDRTTILIVGAGPAGLSAALSLLHHGFHDFVIVDAVSEGANASRAILVQASALETLESVGLNDGDLVSKGLKDSVFNVETRRNKFFCPQFQRLKPYTRHPYVLIIPQNLTEHLLEKKLASLAQYSTFEDGKVITAKYVIGADGARSVIRTLAGIGFSDPINPEGQADNGMAQLVIADVTLGNKNPDDLTSHMTLSKETLFFCFPYPYAFNETLQIPTSERVYRIGCGVPVEEGEIPHAPSREYLQKLVDRFGPYQLSSDPSVSPNPRPTYIKDVIWRSRFRSHAAVADTTFVRLEPGEACECGAILLIGDASHIHSVAGGQGMNLGIHDGVSLGEALTKHIRTSETEPVSEADVILPQFADRPRGIALEVIKLSKGFLAIEGMNFQKRMAWWFPIDSETFRTWALWVLGHIPFAQKMLVWEVSGLSGR